MSEIGVGLSCVSCCVDTIIVVCLIVLILRFLCVSEISVGLSKISVRLIEISMYMSE